MFQEFPYDSAVPSADHKDPFRLLVREARHMREHLMINKFIGLRKLDFSIQSQHFPESLPPENLKQLIIGLHGLQRFENADGQCASGPQRALLGKVTFLKNLAHCTLHGHDIRNAGWIL